MKRLGMPASDDTIIHHLKRRMPAFSAKTTVRVAGMTIGLGAKAAIMGPLSSTWSGEKSST
jgi:hypothetical protein